MSKALGDNPLLKATEKKKTEHSSEDPTTLKGVANIKNAPRLYVKPVSVEEYSKRKSPVEEINSQLKKPQNEREPLFTQEDIEAIKAAQIEEDEFTVMTFRIRKTYLKKLRDFAYTNRLEIREALDDALGAFLNPIDDSDLLEYREKKKRARRT